MTKVSSFPTKSNPSPSDTVGGNDNENGKKFVNFTIESIVSLVNSISGKDYITYKFSPNYGSIGLFSSNEAITNPTQITKLFFNKQSVSKEDLTALFVKLDTLQNIVIDLRNPSNSNNFATFKITNITNQTEYFELDVTLFKNFYSGNLVANATYSAYFDVKENFEDKLDQGNYVGTAETLKTDIETRQPKSAGKSLVADAEITKLSHLDDTTDLQKPVSIAQQVAIDSAIQAQITDSTALLDPTIPIVELGNVHILGVGAGTYPEWGGMVIPDNNFGTLQRVDGVYSVSLTPISGINLLATKQEIKLKANLEVGKNLFNYQDEDVLIDKSFGGGGAAISDTPNFIITGYIPVLPGQILKCNRGAGGYAHNFYDEEKNYISSVTTDSAFTIPADIYFLRAVMNYNGFPIQNMQIELGNTSSTFESYTLSVAIEELGNAVLKEDLQPTIDANNDLFLNKNVNLLDESKINVDLYQNDNGVLSSNPYNLSTTDFIPLASGQSLVFSNLNSANNQYVCFFTNKFQFISSALSDTFVNNVVVGVANCAYVRLPFDTNLIGAKNLQVEYGTTRTAYKPFGYTLKDEYVKYISGENLINKNDFFNGGLYDTSGKLKPSNVPNTERTSRPIKVKAGDKIFTNNVFNFTLAEYDVNENYLRGHYGTVGISTPYIIGENTVYFRISTEKDAWENLLVRISDNPIERYYYIPYAESVPAVVPASLKQDIIIPKKIWGLNNEKLVLFTNAIKKRYVDDDYYLIAQYGTNNLLVNKRTNASTSDNLTTNRNFSVNLYDRDFLLKKIISSQLISASLATNTGAVVVNPIGDSITDINFQYEWVSNNCPAVSFTGCVYNDQTNLFNEGHSGWTLSQYLTIIHSPVEWAGFSPMLHPTDNSLNYYGCTKLWIAEYNYAVPFSKMKVRGDVVGGFSPTTGLRLTPNTNDVQYVYSESVYKRYNGSSWVTISDPTFVFNYAKYISVWQLAVPTHVPIQIGTNDFSRVTELEAIANFNAIWKTQMDTVITGIHTYNSNIKIGIIIPPLRATVDIDDANWNAPINACMWQERKTIIDNYDDREGEKIYVIDGATALDSENHYGELGVIIDSVHPNGLGFAAIGKRIAAWLQGNR